MTDPIFKGAKGGSSAFKQTPDNLRSNDTFEGVLGMAIGPLKGPVNGLKSIKLDGTAVENETGELNFKDFVVNYGNGDPALWPQTITLQLGAGAAPVPVGLTLTNPNTGTGQGTPGPWVVKTLSNTGANAIDLRFIVNQLYRQDKKGVYDETLTLEIQLKPVGKTTWINPTIGTTTGSGTYNPQGSSFNNLFRTVVPESWYDVGGPLYNGGTNSYQNNFGVSGKTTSSPSVYELRLQVPTDGSYANVAWDVRVRLLERDNYDNGSSSDPQQEKRDVSWESLAAVYGNTMGTHADWQGVAWMQMYGKASDQLTGVPEVTSEWYTKVVSVPPSTVYNPDTRQYTATIWDGSWAKAYTNDPAWVIADAISDPLAGLSLIAEGSYLNKWDALEASKWCSTLVPDGNGGTHPRYSMNLAINDPQKAEDFIRYLAGAVGGLAWDRGDGEWRLKMDKPDTPVDIFTLENIVGEFIYSHTDVDTRFNDITGQFLNAEMDYRQDAVRLYDNTSIAQIGRKPSTVALVGCTNRQEALRRVKLRLRTATQETRIVNFSTNRRGRNVEPLSLILVADGDLGDSDKHTTGRIVSISADRKTIQVRDPVRMEVGVAYQINFAIPNPNYNPKTTTQPTSPDWRKPTISQSIALTNTSAQVGNVTTLYLATALPTDIATNMSVALSATGLVTTPKLYRVTAVMVGDDGETMQISAIEVDTGKWDAADNVSPDDSVFVDLRGAVPTPIPPVSGSTLSLLAVPVEQGKQVNLVANWIRPAGAFINGFRVRYRINGGEWTLGIDRTQSTTFEIINPTPGIYDFEISTLSRAGGVSTPLTASFTVTQELIDATQIYYIDPVTGDPTVPINDLAPAEPGADVTGNNTANDTAHIGGRPTGAVLTALDAAANDLIAPNVPTGLAITSSVVTDPVTGVQTITMVATCTASTAPDIGGYDFAVQQGSGSYLDFRVVSPRLEIKVPANTAFNVKVRAVDTSGNASGYCTPVAHTSAKDTTAPGVPTGLAVTQGYTSLWLNWTNPADLDLASIEVWENTTNNSGTATKIATVSVEAGSPGSYSRVGLTTGGQRFYWLKAVDTSNNTSAFSTGANGTPGSVVVTDLSGFITADQIAAGFGSGGANLVLNGNAEGGIAPATPGWKIGNFTSAGSTFTASAGAGVNGGNAFVATKTASANQSSGRSRAFPVKQSTPYNLRLQAHADTATTAGFYLRIYYFSAIDANGYGTTAVGSTVDLTGASNAALGTAWTQFDQTLTTPSGARYMAVEVINYTTSTALNIFIDDVEVRDQLTSGQIGAGFVTGSMLQAGAIDITKFATGLAPVEKLSALPSTGNFEGRQVYLTTDKKVYRWTDTSTTGTTFWSKQTDGADIKANSVVAGSFVAGAIQAADISAKQINATHLLIGDAANQIRDPEYRSLGAVGAGTFWQQSSGGTTPPSTTVSTDTNVTGTMLLARALKFDLTGSSSGSFNNISTSTTNFIPVQPGAAYRFICQALVKAGWNGRLSCDLQWYTAAGAYTGVTDTMSWGNYNNAPAATDVSYANGTMSSSSAPGKQYIVAPSNGSFLSITIKNSNASTTPAGIAYVGDPFLNRMADGQLVVDGAITATAIAANSIDAQRMVLSTRGITVSGLEFTHNNAGVNNQLGWSSGNISYVDDSGTVQTVAISAGTANWTSGTLYAYWTQNATTISTTTSAAVALGGNVALMATYLGGTNLVATYGRTIIDGSKIYANSIGAAQISAGAISTGQLAVGILGGNLVGNPGAETGSTDGWAIDPTFNTAGGVFSASTSDKNAGSYSFLLSKTATANQLGVDSRAMPVTPGKTYAIRWYDKGSSATASGWYLRVHQGATYPTSGYISSGTAASFTDLISNGAIAASWTLREFTYTAPAGVYWVSLTPINFINGPLNVWVDDFQLIEQNTTTMIANGAIVTAHISVGTLNGDRIQTNTLDATAVKAGSVLAGTITVGGTTLTTAVSNAANGQTAYTGTTNYRTTGAPTNNPTPSSITITDNTNGTRDIQLNWNAYTQGANKADFLILFWNKTSTAPTINDASISFSVNTSGGSYYRFEGVNPAQAYSFGIAAARRTENGLEIGTIVSPTSAPQWVNVAAGTPNFTANVGGTSAATVVSNAALGAQDPGTRINAASTQIDPGKILISGAVSLANWRNGTDATKIEGGSIAANTVDANKLKIGSRGINVQDITFQTTGGNTLTWTAGVIFYVDDTGTLITKTISAGSTGLLAGPSYAYVYWAKGASSLSVGNSTTANSDPNVLMAVYQGGNSFTPLYGATIVDGSRITTGSITAVQVGVGTLTGDRIAANTITADNMVIGSRGGNSVLNANGASGTQGWALGETANAGGTLSTTSNFATTGRTGFIITKGSVPNDGAGFSAKAIPVVPGKTYVFRAWVYGTSATASGLYLRVMYMTSVPSTGYVTNANRTGYTDLVAGGAIPATATFYEYTWTCPAGVTMASPAIYNWQVGPTQMLFSDVEFFEQGTSVTIKDGAITASKLSVSSLDAISATIGLLRTATSGQRMELESNQVRVYDSAGTLRVRLGIW